MLFLFSTRIPWLWTIQFSTCSPLSAALFTQKQSRNTGEATGGTAVLCVQRQERGAENGCDISAGRRANLSFCEASPHRANTQIVRICLVFSVHLFLDPSLHRRFPHRLLRCAPAAYGAFPSATVANSQFDFWIRKKCDTRNAGRSVVFCYSLPFFNQLQPKLQHTYIQYVRPM